MNIPMELADVLNWRDTAPSIDNRASNGAIREAAVDNFLSVMYPVTGHMVQFGVDYHNFMDRNDPVGLLEFIEKYKVDSYWRLARFANGLEKDIDAVRNTLLYPDISNGPVEGINSIIKCVKRMGGGRAKIDLLSATMVLRQLHKDSEEINRAS